MTLGRLAAGLEGLGHGLEVTAGGLVDLLRPVHRGAADVVGLIGEPARADPANRRRQSSTQVVNQFFLEYAGIHGLSQPSFRL